MVQVTADIDLAKLRNLAAILATLSGASQCLSLWLLPTTPTLLLTGLCGALYMVLALGLFGIARLALLLAIAIPVLRTWFGLYPLELPAWEFLRIAADLAIAALCIPVLWSSLDPGHTEIAPGLRPDTTAEPPADA